MRRGERWWRHACPRLSLHALLPLSFSHLRRVRPFYRAQADHGRVGRGRHRRCEEACVRVFQLRSDRHHFFPSTPLDLLLPLRRGPRLSVPRPARVCRSHHPNIVRASFSVSHKGKKCHRFFSRPSQCPSLSPVLTPPGRAPPTSCLLLPHLFVPPKIRSSRSSHSTQGSSLRSRSVTAQSEGARASALRASTRSSNQPRTGSAPSGPPPAHSM